ncbi:MAG TPA: septation regulator SpoVG [Clostridia bacterium]|jgi:stage V sporulation protein G|nr:septation regulator SpoVG [Clostridia bacterium]
MLNITDIRVKVLTGDNSKLCAVASIIIDDVFVVHDIKVIRGTEGCFIVMPSRRTPAGEYKDIAHPLNTETRELIKNLVLAKYEEELAKQ